MSDGADPNLNPNPDNGGNPPAGALKPDKDPVPYERFSEVNKQLSDLKKWKQEQEAAAAEQAKKQADAEAARLAEQGQFKTLAETWQQKAAELEPYKAQVEEANATLQALLATELENPNIPESTRELLAEMTPAKALAHIAKHKPSWTKAAPNGAGSNPAGSTGKGLTTEEQQKRSTGMRRAWRGM